MFYLCSNLIKEFAMKNEAEIKEIREIELRNDSENLHALDLIKDDHSKIMNDFIRLQTEFERNGKDLDDLFLFLKEHAETNDLDKARDVVRGNYKTNTKATNEFLDCYFAAKDAMKLLKEQDAELLRDKG